MQQMKSSSLIPKNFQLYSIFSSCYQSSNPSNQHTPTSSQISFMYHTDFSIYAIFTFWQRHFHFAAATLFMSWSVIVWHIHWMHMRIKHTLTAHHIPVHTTIAKIAGWPKSYVNHIHLLSFRIHMYNVYRIFYHFTVLLFFILFCTNRYCCSHLLFASFLNGKSRKKNVQ